MIRTCPECKCKLAGFNEKTPADLMQFSQQDSCAYCKGWSIAPIPYFELEAGGVKFINFIFHGDYAWDVGYKYGYDF